MKSILALVLAFVSSVTFAAGGSTYPSNKLSRITQIKSHCSVVLQHTVTTVWVATHSDISVMSERRLI